MNRVFITGRGLLTPIGNGKNENEAGLRAGISGLHFMPDWAEQNLECQVAGKVVPFEPHPLLDRKKLRFCPPSAIMSVSAVAEALEEAQIPLETIRDKRIAVIGGVAGSYFQEIYESTFAFQRTGKLREISPFIVPRVMPSSSVSNLSLIFGFTGESYDISAACSSGAISIGLGMRLVQNGLYDIVVCGGAEHLDWVEALGFCATRALARKYNDTPEKASRPFDRNRDGFILAEGAGYVVLESEKSVKSRGVRPITEMAAFASNSNAHDMVVPDTESSRRVMEECLNIAGLKPSDVAYVNTHGTATPVGDPVEIEAVRRVFGNHIAINSTKSQTGHMVGATGAVELIFTSIMLEKKFISPTINLDEPEEAFADMDLVRELRTGVNMKHAISNSFAFGGSNACVLLSDCAE